MSWKKGIRFPRTATFRLTIWYLFVFGALSVAGFLVVYISLAFRLQDQTDFALLNEANEFSTLYLERGTEVLQTEFVREAESQGTGQVLFRLIAADGTSLASSDPNHWQGVATGRPQFHSGKGSAPSYRTLLLPGRKHKVRILTLPISEQNMIEAAISLRHEESILSRFRETFSVTLAIMIGCGGIFGFLLARKAMASVQRVTDTASRIGRNDLGSRVALADEGEEIDALVRAFNDMLARIELVLGEFRQVTDNVAHELRTPITRIRGMAETTLKGEDKLGEYQEMAAWVIDGCDDLIEMIATMLEIAQTDSGAIALELEPLDLRDLVEEAVELFAPVAEDKEIGLHVDTTSRAVKLMCDRRKIQRVVANLIDNSIKYTPRQGAITIAIGENATIANMSITDTGPGIDETDLPHIFERFYRADKSRSTIGSGLGLALAEAIIHAHHGEITVKSSTPGSTFTVLLPKDTSSPVLKITKK